MRKQRNVKTMAAALGLFSAFSASGLAIAQEFSVPHNFSAGERAQAVQVNQNFSATAGAINDNAAALSAALQSIAALEQAIADLQTVPAVGGVPVYSAGQIIGTFLDHGDEARLLSPAGYVFHATMTDYGPSFDIPVEAWLRTETLYFADANCLGDAYIAPPDGPYFRWEIEHGVVFRDAGSAGAPYYVPRSAVGASQTYNSVLSGANCSLQAGEALLWQALPNDEAVTGVPNAPYAKPFSIGVP
jgi:hypothetical protein